MAGRGTPENLKFHFSSFIPPHHTMQEQFEPLKNDLLLRAARGMYTLVISS